ncbi:MAG: GAF domain-containing protein [Anaerolineales bacterium]|jgi:GAF domain-containing protein|nr:GAF domain-containing protein [Chloroflexota bacterium]MCC6984978.1 GAF domain-containing protein [Anaerolineales bacterium]
MINSIRQTFAPPIFDDEENTRLAALLNRILWAVIIIGSIYTVAAPFILGQIFSPALTAVVVIAGIAARSLMLRGRIRPASTILLVVFNAILILSILLSDGVIGASYPSLVLTTVLAGVLLGGRGAYSFAAINSLIGLGFVLFQDSIPEPLIPQSPVTYFTSLIVYVFFIAALLQASAESVTKILTNLRMTRSELTAKNEELQKFTTALESTIAARTSELDAANLRSERRARQFEAIARISRAITQTQDFNTLLEQVTELISEQFNFYHTGVFLLDANNEYAVLIAANSPGGKRMLQRNHRLRIGQTGIVGYVAGTGLPRIALDTGADAAYFNNPDLPDTRSEMALPLLRKGNEVIGVLDAQSRDPNAFTQEDVRALTTLADQVTIAIENSRLFEAQKRTLNEAQAVYNREFSESWLRFTKSKGITGIQRRNLKSSLLSEPLELPGADEALRSGDAFQTKDLEGATVLTLPVKLREQTLGTVTVKGINDRPWTEDEMDIAQAIMERAALSIENARLLEESMAAAERERVIGEISTKISAGTQVEEILKTAVRELGTQIPGAQVTVEVGGGG